MLKKSKLTWKKKIKNNILSYNENPKHCLQCNTPIPYDKKANKFCSKSCAATYNNLKRERKEETRLKQKEAAIKGMKNGTWKIPEPKSGKDNPRYKDGKWIPLLKRCPVCDTEFFSVNKFCSDDCWSLDHQTKIRGYIPKVKYFCKELGQEVYLQSSWEVEVAKLLDELEIKWIRPKPVYYHIDGKRRRYYADFFLPDFNLYLDPKNPFVQRCDKEKIEAVLLENKIDLIVDELDPMLDLIKNL